MKIAFTGNRSVYNRIYNQPHTYNKRAFVNKSEKELTKQALHCQKLAKTLTAKQLDKKKKKKGNLSNIAYLPIFAKLHFN